MIQASYAFLQQLLFCLFFLVYFVSLFCDIGYLNVNSSSTDANLIYFKQCTHLHVGESSEIIGQIYRYLCMD